MAKLGKRVAEDWMGESSHPEEKEKNIVLA
jgi:hypothetical protein